MWKLFLTIAVLGLISACQQNTAEIKPQNAKSSPVASPGVATNSMPANSKIKTFNGTGKVTKIDLNLVSAELDHDEIKGLMPAMRMEFYVKEKSELEALKVGDKVEFVLEDNNGIERIISIKKAQ